MDAELDKLSQLLANVNLLKEEPGTACEIFDSIIKKVEKPEEANSDELSRYAALSSGALSCGLIEVETKAAETIAEVCKNEVSRPALSNADTIVPLLRLLASNVEAQTQACRALGNICFDNNNGRALVFQNNGLPEIVALLRKCSQADSSPVLRTNCAGCFLNLIMGQENVYPKIIDMGVVDLLCEILSRDIGTKQAEDTAVHIYVILSLLIDCGERNVLLSEKLCEVTVKILETSTNGELSELCVEVLHSQAENEEVRLHLAKAGLCELLIDLIAKHCKLADDDETRNLLKLACDLIVIILNGDDSMELIYAGGQGKVFKGLISWLDSQDDDLQVTAVLAMANFARTDTHCIQMVKTGISKKLLSLIALNNNVSAKIRLQHALLSALRNLVIPTENKPLVLSEGLLDTLYPMIHIPTFPVVFKLLGTLRMVIDGQKDAASQLGKKEELIKKLVEWSTTEDHPGVQGEASRLFAWIIKNNRNKEMYDKLISQGVISCLVRMLNAEHVVMQLESLLALTLVVSEKANCETALIDAGIGNVLVALLSKDLSKELFQNLLTFLSQLSTQVLQKNLQEAGLVAALSAAKSKHSSELQEQANAVLSLLNSG